MKTLVYIASDVRSGSTLLDNMLSNHPQAESVGELRLLTAHIKKQPVSAPWNGTCSCQEPIEKCKVWSQVCQIYEEQQGHPFAEVDSGSNTDCRTPLFHPAMLLAILVPIRSIKKWLFKHAYRQEPLYELGRTCYCLSDAFSRVVGTSMIVDSSKKVQQLHALIAAKPEDWELKVIHIVRDGRAVVYSKMKRAQQYKGYGVTFKLIPAIRGWCYINLQVLLSKCFFESADFMTIRYEDLCQDREAVLRRICEHLDISFNKAMLHLSSDNKHNIGGSSHRFDWHAETPIRLDERWRSGMSLFHKAVYYTIAGIIHKRLGY